ncbi:hypothetical protein N431DRAFT_386751 [Stipitochalara longipes BDJ]|nr:hypothetical protein N431DRAFT_386751 [Stipitochalara longipes BDJ]
MDPVSILASVSAASRAALALSTTLFTFVQATRQIDQSVRGLYDEVTGLNTVLDAIRSSIQAASFAKGKQAERIPGLWQSVVTSLDHCCETVGRLHGSIKEIQKPSSNMVGQALRALKLNWNEDQIKTLRSQIQIHNAALQLALQMINVHLASITPTLVTDDLIPRIEILTDMVMQLSQIHASSGHQNQETYANVSVTTTSLMVSAQNVMNEVKSIVAKSDNGSEQSSSVTTILHHLDLLEKDVEDSITVTEKCQPSGPNKANVTRHPVVDDWIPTVPLGSHASDFDSSSIATRTQMTPTQSTCETPSLGSNYPQSVAEDDSDTDDDFEYEILQGFLDRGFALYKESDWAGAQPFLRRGIDTSKKLLADKLREKNIKLDEAEFKTAVCATHQNNLEDAEAALFQLRTTRPAANENRDILIRRILAIHLFAFICYNRNEFDDAHKHCRKALSMKRKLFAKDMPWLESTHFSLLSDIAKAKDDLIAADVYNAKAHEYGALAPRTDLEPEFHMAKFDILRARGSLETNTSLFMELKTITDATECRAFQQASNFYVQYAYSPSISNGLPSTKEFNELSLDFYPGSFYYFQYNDLSVSNVQIAIQIGYQGAIQYNSSSSIQRNDIKNFFEQMKRHLNETKYDQFRVPQRQQIRPIR